MRKIPLILFALFEFIIIILLIAALSACTPIERLQRLQTRHPQLFDRANDTIRITDTINIVIPSTQFDTTLQVARLRIDTVTIYKDGITTKIFINKNDSLYLENIKDTVFVDVIREIEVPYTRYTTDRKPRDHLRISLVIITILLGTIYYLSRKKKKEQINNETTVE